MASRRRSQAASSSSSTKAMPSTSSSSSLPAPGKMVDDCPSPNDSSSGKENDNAVQAVSIAHHTADGWMSGPGHQIVPMQQLHHPGAAIPGVSIHHAANHSTSYQPILNNNVISPFLTHQAVQRLRQRIASSDGYPLTSKTAAAQMTPDAASQASIEGLKRAASRCGSTIESYEGRQASLPRSRQVSGSSTPAAAPSAANVNAAQASSSSTPSLYETVFGPQVARQLQAAVAVDTPKTPPPPSDRAFFASTPGSSGRSGLSARLHAISSTPQLGSPERARRGGPPVGIDPHNAPSQEHLEREDELAFAHPRQSWVVSSSKSPSAARSYHGSHHGLLQPSIRPQTPSKRGRLQSSGGAPTSLAQGLGITGSGGPRARNPSTHSTPNRVRFSMDAQSSPSLRQAPQTSEETDRVAEMLVAMADKRKRDQEGEESSDHVFSTPTKRQATWADPSSITPRRAKLAAGPASSTLMHRQDSSDAGATSDNDSRKSANLLLYLAGSPNRSSNARSHQRSATSNGEGSSQVASPLARRASMAATPSELEPALELKAGPRTTDSRSPPITPPQSDRLRPAVPSRSVAAAGQSEVADTPPATPHLAIEEGSAAFVTPSRRRRQFSQNPDGTPRTPSPVPSVSSNPRTPHTPHQSAFAYSEFVNVSPSPQPRSRGPSGRFTQDGHPHFEEGASWDDVTSAGWTMQQRLDGTPVKKSTSRFESATSLTAGPQHHFGASSPPTPLSASKRRSQWTLHPSLGSIVESRTLGGDDEKQNDDDDHHLHVRSLTQEHHQQRQGSPSPPSINPGLGLDL